VSSPIECFTNSTCTVDAVERAAGLSFFSDEVKKDSKHICQSAKCEVIVRRFDDAQKNVRAIAAPK
jgi:endonuclease G